MKMLEALSKKEARLERLQDGPHSGGPGFNSILGQPDDLVLLWFASLSGFDWGEAQAKGSKTTRLCT